MKISELIHDLTDIHENHGDMDIEICKYTAEDKSFYWASCAFERDGVFIIGFNVESLVNRKNHANNSIQMGKRSRC